MSNEIQIAKETKIESLSEKAMLKIGRECLLNIAENLVLLSRIVHELMKRGSDLSWCPQALIPICQKIAAGQLHPSIFWEFKGVHSRLLFKLPFTIQKQIVNKKTISVFEPGGNGGDMREYRWEDMTSLQRRIAIGPRGIRSKEEQRSLYKREMEFQGIKNARSEVEYIPNKRKGCLEIIIGDRSIRIPAAQLAQYLSQIT